MVDAFRVSSTTMSVSSGVTLGPLSVVNAQAGRTIVIDVEAVVIDTVLEVQHLVPRAAWPVDLKLDLDRVTLAVREGVREAVAQVAIEVMALDGRC